MNRLIFLIPIFLLFGCNSQKNELTINLQHVKGYGPFRNGRVITFPSRDSIHYKGVPKDLDEYVVRSIIMQSRQHFWNLYKSGKMTKERFNQLATYYSLDSTKLTSDFVDSEIIMLTGTRHDRKRLIIIDSNNDEDFSGDRILEFEFPVSKEKEEELEKSTPVISADFEYYREGKITAMKANLQPSPYRGSLGVTYNTDNEVEKKYDLFISYPEHRYGQVKINHSKYDIYVSNGFSSMQYSKQRASIYVCKSGEKPSEIKGDLPYQIGDIFNTGKQDYSIDNISVWGDTLSIKYIGENTHPEGFIEGLRVPKFISQKLDHSEFSLKDYPGKFILLDFWGTWCNPCIKSIPDIKELHKDFRDKNLVLVSVAFDTDVEKVTQFVKDQQMDWEHVFVDQKTQDKANIVEKLRVTAFPTTILISPDGLILARNKPLTELRVILKEKLK